MELTNIWVVIEWVSVFLGLGGTIWAASLKGHKLWIVFLMWIIGNTLMIVLHFSHTGKYGLLLLSIIGLVISITGFLNSIKENNESKESQTGSKLQKSLIGLSVISALLSVMCLGYFLFIDFNDNWYKSFSFEMVATFLNISGLALISSNSRYSKYCWLFWLLSNGMFVFITYSTGYMGLMFQQVIFFGLDLWGILNWFILKNNSITQKSKEKTEPKLQ